MTSTPPTTTSAAAQQVAALVRSGRLCLTTHVNPDGDGLGSEVGLVHILRAQGIEAIITNPTATPERFDFLFADLKGVDKSQQGVKELRRADAILVLDIADLGRLGTLADTVRDRGVPVGCIDHHASAGVLPAGPRYVDDTAAATGELIYLLAQQLGWKVPLEAARALYVALVTDTGGFRFSNTRPRTLQIASELLAIGVDTEQIYLDVYASAPIGRPRLLAEVLQTLVVEMPAGLAWVTVPPGALERHEVDPDDLDGAVEHARSVRGVRMALLFREMSGGRVKVSLRSVGQVDVAALAKQFGGGGHTKAAGVAIHGSLAEVQATVLAAARDFLAGA
ncbi:MAG: bifunctional oligoribonuclease/PAP phosphatase NrnA [Gemmatimonadales bacterium]